jgi:hypothetical protein
MIMFSWKKFLMPKGRKILISLIFLFIFYLIVNPGEDYLLAVVLFIIFYLTACAFYYKIRSLHI